MDKIFRRRYPRGAAKNLSVNEIKTTDIGNEFEILWNEKLAEGTRLPADRSLEFLRWHYTGNVPHRHDPLAHYSLSRYSPGTSSCGTSCVRTSPSSASPAYSTPFTTSAFLHDRMDVSARTIQRIMKGGANSSSKCDP
jgi:hypothetical protein